LSDFFVRGSTPTLREEKRWKVHYPHYAGLDVHKDTVVACVRHMVNGSVRREVRTFKTTTTQLLALSDWLAAEGCTRAAMEATGVYWKPVWHILSDGDFSLVLANAAHDKNVPHSDLRIRVRPSGYQRIGFGFYSPTAPKAN
jgi:Transposase